ncbi:hypothetical protein [Streptomyces sp. H39-C1]|uniref:hypothetical protein n=1 Tax=Streptomyces sp. H39-C1 TaxID=3004355 RepID=UPI0022AF1BD7|nr:hypothetical protein [Streptomyces sp. H39-C1]MCZ4098036.1 hypothetical protein [Streptomyces sp. H39-C1]
MDAIPFTIDGFLETEPVHAHGDTHGTTADFRVISSPTDRTMDETLLPCATGDPRLAYALLTELKPGDLLRLSGLLVLPDRADGGMRLQVDALEVLDTVPLCTTRDADQFTFDRHGDYIAISDSTAVVHVWTEGGTWVGTAPDPASVDILITAYEIEDRSLPRSKRWTRPRRRAPRSWPHLTDTTVVTAAQLPGAGAATSLPPLAERPPPPVPPGAAAEHLPGAPTDCPDRCA